MVAVSLKKKKKNFFFFFFFYFFFFFFFFFFFKQKTAYEIVVRDWSSDVCSSDLCPQQSPAVPSCSFGSCVLMALGGSLLDQIFEQIGRASCRERVSERV